MAVVPTILQGLESRIAAVAQSVGLVRCPVRPCHLRCNRTGPALSECEQNARPWSPSLCHVAVCAPAVSLCQSLTAHALTCCHAFLCVCACVQSRHQHTSAYIEHVCRRSNNLMMDLHDESGTSSCGSPSRILGVPTKRAATIQIWAKCGYFEVLFLLNYRSLLVETTTRNCQTSDVAIQLMSGNSPVLSSQSEPNRL